jgi:glycosyltransferase involved in cell wall biosynthesis
MRIALVVPGGVDESGEDRVIPALLWLIERLARRHEVHVFALHQEPVPRDWALLGARVHNIGWAERRRRRFLARFAAEHRAAPFDVVHAIFGGAGSHAAVAGWRHRIPAALHLAGGELVALHAIGYGTRCTVRGRIMLRVALAGARHVTVATPSMRRLAAGLGIATELVPLGVALDRWPPRAPRPRDVGRPARLLHIGDLRPVKDQATLLAAAEALREHGVDFRLDLAGCDTMEGAVQRSEAARRLGGLVRWHGVLRRDALRALVEEADVLLVSSRHEAGPLAVLEAAVAGVPTVGTAVGHVEEWAPDAAAAVPVGDARALARETAALLADEPRRLALAREAQRRAMVHDADDTATRFERIYESLLHARGRSTPPGRPERPVETIARA